MYLLGTVTWGDGWEHNMKKNVLVCVPWKAETKENGLGTDGLFGRWFQEADMGERKESSKEKETSI